jgi:hypothetical protein
MINPNVLNIIGCFAAAVYLAYAMKNTHKDDADKMLLNFEWTLLAGLILVALDQLRDAVSLLDSIPSMASVGVTIMWVASFLFSAHLKIAYR